MPEIYTYSGICQAQIEEPAGIINKIGYLQDSID
jgi:hypothetical protein